MEEIDGDDMLKKIIAVLMARFDVRSVVLTDEDLVFMQKKFNDHVLRIRGTPTRLNIDIVRRDLANEQVH